MNHITHLICLCSQLKQYRFIDDPHQQIRNSSNIKNYKVKNEAKIKGLIEN